MRLIEDELDERILLGEILAGEREMGAVSKKYSIRDFQTAQHRRIFQHMLALYRHGTPVDRISLANELMKSGELESCGGLSYLIVLTELGSPGR